MIVSPVHSQEERVTAVCLSGCRVVTAVLEVAYHITLLVLGLSHNIAGLGVGGSRGEEGNTYVITNALLYFALKILRLPLHNNIVAH